MIVKTSELPISILNQLPLSIRIQDEIEVDSLPLNLREIIYEYLNNTIINTDDDLSSVYDISLTRGEYDLKHVTDIKEAIKNYIMNFFKIRKGTYPFDPEFGTTLYEKLQTKNTTIVQLAINSEITDLLSQLQDLFGVYIKVNKVIIQNLEQYDHAIVTISIELTVDTETTVINLNFS
jgi:hypothetical protein